MPEHGDYDPQEQKWYCGYWMTADEWFDIHDYAPAEKSEEQEEEQG
jgi:hypothetical protein